MRVWQRHSTQFLKIIIFTASSVFLFSAVTYAQAGSSIKTTLCDDVSEPTVIIEQPISDSVVDTASAAVSGTTERTTQIDLFVNDNYSHTVTIEDDGSFSTTAPLEKGTNTIRLDAYFSCNQTNTSSAVAITYEPAVVPSDGGSVPTDVDNLPSGRGTGQKPGSQPSPTVQTTEDGSSSAKPPITERIKEKLFPSAQTSGDQSPNYIRAAIYWAGVVALFVSTVSSLFTGSLLALFGAETNAVVWGIALKSIVRIISIIISLLLLIIIVL